MLLNIVVWGNHKSSMKKSFMSLWVYRRGQFWQWPQMLNEESEVCGPSLTVVDGGSKSVRSWGE